MTRRVLPIAALLFLTGTIIVWHGSTPTPPTSRNNTSFFRTGIDI